MSGPNELVQRWLDYAADDLIQVTNNLNGKTISIRGATYHCQQAIEKLIKATIVLVLQKDPPHSHNIRFLTQLLPKDYPLYLEFEELDVLTIMALTSRYPDDEDEESPLPDTNEIKVWYQAIHGLIAKFCTYHNLSLPKLA